MHTKGSIFAEQQLLCTMSDKQIWPNEAASSSSLSLQIRNTWYTQKRMHTKHTHTDVRIHWWHTSQQEHRFSGCFCLLCVKTQLSEYKPEEVGTSHLSFTLIFFLLYFPFHFVHFFSISISLSFPALATPTHYRHPKPSAFKLVKPPFVTRLHPYLHTHNAWHNPTTGKALSQNRQENSGKPGYNLALMEPKRFPPGRWALSYWEKPKDRQRKLHPGKCLCSTLGSLAFCPANEWLFVYS